MKRARGWYWPWLITASLLFTVGANVVMLVAANGNGNGVVVEPDYYRKAVEWDRTMARRAASDSLGWVASAVLQREGGARSGLLLELRDRSGMPVSGATVSATLIHNLTAAHPTKVQLVGATAGDYRAVGLPLDAAGQWEIRVEATRGESRFLQTLHADLLAMESPTPDRTK